jgi:outer membrane protein assembly factor BamB
MLDLNSGKVKWENDQIASDFMPVVAADGNLIMVGSKAAAKLESESGKILWSFQVEEKKNNFEAFDANLALTVGYFYQKRGGNGIVTAIDLLSGHKKWEKELSTKKAPELTATGFGVIVADEKNFNLLDAESGNTKWTASKLSGLVVDLGGNLGIAVAEKDKYLTVLNKDSGAEIWSKKIKGIQIDQIIGAGIMYTDEKGEFGLVSFEGKDLWTGKDKIGGNGTVLRARPSLGTEIFYSDGKVYHIDLLNGNKKVLIDDIKFQEKEAPDGLDYTGQNFVLSSSQNMLGFDESGKVLFQHHWPSPKISLAGRIALRTMQVAAVAMASATALGAGDAYGASGFGSSAGTTVQQRQLASQSQSFQDMAGGMGDAANKRFKASKSKGDYSLVLTDVNGDVGLKKIDKMTGKELGSIVLKDKNPVYDFDPVNGTLFYKPSKKEVICYAL